MARGWDEVDPDKGKPHRHVRVKIDLLLSDLDVESWADAGVLYTILMKVAEKRPEEVLDAVTFVMSSE